MNDGRAEKELDYSAFTYSGSGIPQEIHEFFDIDQSNRDVFLVLGDKHFPAKIQWQIKSRGNSLLVRICWDKSFTELLKLRFADWTDLDPGSRIGGMSLIFRKTNEND